MKNVQLVIGVVAGLLLGVAVAFGYGWLTARPAAAAIHGPATAESLTPVLFDGSASRGQVWEWYAMPAGPGASHDSSFVDLEDGRVVFLFRTPGKYRVKLVVQSAAGGRFSRAEAIHEILVGDEPFPPPPPGPTPPGPVPPPVPPTPPSTLKAAATAHAMNLVNDPGRKDQAKTIAEVYRSVASAIGSNVLPTPVEAESHLQEMLRQRLGDDLRDRVWKPWVEAMKKETKKLLPIDSSMTAVQTAFNEIAAGLDEVK